MSLKRKKPTANPSPNYRLRLVISNLGEIKKITRKLKKERGVKTIPLEELFKYCTPELKAIPYRGFKGFISKVAHFFQRR